jgi:hypothetical protein
MIELHPTSFDGFKEGPAKADQKLLLTDSGTVPLELSELPYDFDLPGLISLLHGDRLRVKLSPILANWLGPSAKLLNVRAYLRRLFPGKRCTVELELMIDHGDALPVGHRRVLGKFYREDQGASVYETLHALRRSGFGASRFAVPEPIAWAREHRLLLLKWADGTLLSSLLLDRSAAGRQMESAAEWLLRLHHCGITAGRRYSFERHLLTLGRWKELLAEVYPQGERLLNALVSRFEECSKDLAGWTPCPTHRDFSPEHLVIHADRLTCLDLDEFCQYDPLFDVAHFIAHLRFLSLTQSGAIGQFDGLCDRFLDNYESSCEEFSSERLNLYLAISYFKLGRFVALIERPEGWDSLLAQLLAEAERTLRRSTWGLEKSSDRR